MHEIAFPMRWADLDQLNHVNNVVYLDYVSEARAALHDEGLVAGDDAIAGMSVRFVRPMLLSRRPVTVRSTVDGDVLTQDVVAGESMATFASVTTRFGEPGPAGPAGGVSLAPVRVRRSDLGATGAVRPTKVFELFQETRVLGVSTHLGAMTPGSFVVGSSDVTFLGPIAWREQGYGATMAVSRVGRASFEIRCCLVDGDTPLVESTTVLVGFDKTTQRSRPFGDEERVQLEGLLAR